MTDPFIGGIWVNPSIWSIASQHFLTSFPVSCLAVATMWHLRSILPSINSEKSTIYRMVTHPIHPISIKWYCCLNSSYSRKKLLINGFPNIGMHFSTFQQQYCFECCGAAALRCLLFGGPVVGVLFTVGGFSPSINTVLGAEHSSYGSSIDDMSTNTLLISPLVFFLLTTLSLVKILPRKNWNSSHHGNESHPSWVLYSWRIPLISSVGSKIPSSSKMNKKSNECSIASKNLISIIICSQHAGSLSPWTWLIELACHKSTVSKR